MSEDGSPADLFLIPSDGEADPRPIARRLVETCEEFQHLLHGEAAILFLMRAEPKARAQRMILGEMALPRFQGRMADIGIWALVKCCGGEVPDFVCTIDNTWWTQASAIQRDALVYHEMCHCAHALDKEGEPKFTEDGTPIWDIKGHDLEEFDAVALRYGAWSPDIVSFIKAARDGGAA